MNKNTKKNIVVIDDSKDVILGITNILKERYNLKVFLSGYKAMDYINSNPNIDLILLDVLMPEIDGFEMCKQLQENPMTKHIPVIFLTALEKDSDIVYGLKLGAVDYIPKPYSAEVLKARVQTHIKLKEYNDCLVENIAQKESLLMNQSKMATLGEMFENIAHQWKQPLSVISMACSDIEFKKEFGELSDKVLMENIQDIKLSLNNQVETLNLFANFISIDSKSESCNLYSIIEDCKIFLKSKIKHNYVSISNSLDNDISITTNRNYLLQVLINLINNSIDAFDENIQDREIEISSKTDDKHLFLSICDNAGGIKSENIPKIFSKYFTTKKDNGGNGLGLYMAKQIANKKLNGDLVFENQNQGVCFRVIMPLK